MPVHWDLSEIYKQSLFGALPCSNTAVEMLFALHNAMNAQSLAPAKCEPKQRLAIAAKTATVLKQKLRTMRRLRLPLLYDDYAWALPQGALNHLMITVPYWLRCTGRTHVVSA